MVFVRQNNVVVGCIEDLRRFSGISAIYRLGSRIQNNEMGRAVVFLHQNNEMGRVWCLFG